MGVTNPPGAGIAARSSKSPTRLGRKYKINKEFKFIYPGKDSRGVPFGLKPWMEYNEQRKNDI